MGLTVLDWVIAVVLLGGLLRGSMIGAVRQIVSLVGLVVAFLFSVQFMHPVGELIAASLGLSLEAAPLVGFFVLFIGLYLLFLVLSRLVEQVVESLSLTVVDRAAGGLVGSFKAALLMSVIFLALAGIEVPDQDTRRRSVLYPSVVRILPWALEATEGWFPAAREAADELGRQIRPRLNRVRTPPRRSGPHPETGYVSRNDRRVDTKRSISVSVL